MDPKPAVGFVDAIKMFFTRHTDFSTRSRRSEYWNVFLLNTLVSAAIGAIVPNLAWIWALATLVPGIAIALRRLHDTGRSGWWVLIGLVPLIGGTVLVVFLCLDSKPEANKWGPSPKY